MEHYLVHNNGKTASVLYSEFISNIKPDYLSSQVGTIYKAQKFAEKAYWNSLRRDGLTPAIEHPKGVVRRLREVGITDERILAAAWLHDIIEDTAMTREHLKHSFDPAIADIVHTLTRNVDRNTYLQRLSRADRMVQMIKLADAIDNCSSLSEDLPYSTIKHKIDDCQLLLFDLSKKLCPRFYSELRSYLDPWICQ